MSVDEDRKATASDRRKLIINVLQQNLGTPDSPALRTFGERLTERRLMVAGSDIDGLVSSMMVASVCEWRIAALVMRSEFVLVSPVLESLDGLLRQSLFGVDVYSPLFPSISNHPIRFGTRGMRRGGLRDELASFDFDMAARAQELSSINLSVWAQISGRHDSSQADGFTYKYPLGTAQLLLAVLELVGRAPRFYDRQYLPWLVANCDGGLETIRKYHWNAEGWWSALAAVVGPASQSEALYRLATGQRANEFVGVDLRFRNDYGQRADVFKRDWNLSGESLATIQKAVALIEDLGGWPDPFLGGAQSLSDWRRVDPTSNKLLLRGLTNQPLEQVRIHLNSARRAIHVNFSQFFEKGIYLGWMLPDKQPAIESALGPAPDVPLMAEPQPEAEMASMEGRPLD